MHRLLDYTHDDTCDVANRVAMQIHRAVDEHFPNISNTSKKFNTTAFSTSEDTHINQTKSHVEPLHERKDPSSAKHAQTPQKTDLAFSDVKELAPATHQGGLEFSHIDTLSNTSAKMSSGKKILLLLVLITLLSIGTAWFAYRFLVL